MKGGSRDLKAKIIIAWSLEITLAVIYAPNGNTKNWGMVHLKPHVYSTNRRP